MRRTIFAIAIVIAMALCLGAPMTRGAASGTATPFEKLHAAWFTAFDGGDGAAMDKMETDNLALGMPDGTVWYKKEPRAATMKSRAPEVTRSLTDVVVREFGDTAILTGTLVSKEGAETDLSATTVVFVRKAGVWKICSAQWTDRKADKKS